MDEARITITLRPIMIERAIYWILIILLALLLVLCYLNDTAPEEQAEDAAAAAAAELEQTAEEAEDVVEEVTASCDDGILNQDETDVDCGGSCSGCLAGEACETAADCAGDYCVDGQCTNEEPIELSGSVEVAIENIETSINNATDATRVEGIRYEVTNGLDEDLHLAQAKIYLTSKADSDYCLNQMQGEERDCPQPYATFTVPGLVSGETREFTQDLDDDYTGGSYVSNFGTSTYYAPGDDFNLFLYIYDEAGQLIDGREVSAFRTVKG